MRDIFLFARTEGETFRPFVFVWPCERCVLAVDRQ